MTSSGSGLVLALVLLLVYPILVSSTTPTATTVQVSIPIQSQLPPVARVGQPYSWSFSSSTFNQSVIRKGAASNSSFNYVATGLPSWVHFNPSSRSFSGTPQIKDIGTTKPITIKGTAGSSSATDNFQISITSNPPPTINVTLASQISLSNPSISAFLISNHSALGPSPGLRVHPGWSFSIGFLWDTFIVGDGSSPIFYSSTLLSGAPLPPWIKFDNSSLTFDGVAPESAELKTFTIVLYGSDQYAFGGIQDRFNLTVAVHDFSLASIPLYPLNITSPVSLPIDASSYVLIDGKPLSPGDQAALSLNLNTSSIPWASFDITSRTLSGTPPSSASVAQPIVLPLSMSLYNQTITTSLPLAIFPSYFSYPNLPDLTVQQLSNFSFSLSPFISNETSSGETQLACTFDPPSSSSFLQFSTADPPTLYGTVPLTDLTAINVKFSAHTALTNTTSFSSLVVKLSPASSTQATLLSSHHPSNLILALGIAAAVVGSAILIGLLLAYIRKRARKARGGSEEVEVDEKESSIGGEDPEEAAGARHPRTPSPISNPFANATTTTKANFFRRLAATPPRNHPTISKPFPLHKTSANHKATRGKGISFIAPSTWRNAIVGKEEGHLGSEKESSSLDTIIPKRRKHFPYLRNLGAPAPTAKSPSPPNTSANRRRLTKVLSSSSSFQGLDADASEEAIISTAEKRVVRNASVHSDIGGAARSTTYSDGAGSLSMSIASDVHQGGTGSGRPRLVQFKSERSVNDGIALARQVSQRGEVRVKVEDEEGIRQGLRYVNSIGEDGVRYSGDSFYSTVPNTPRANLPPTSSLPTPPTPSIYRRLSITAASTAPSYTTMPRPSATTPVNRLKSMYPGLTSHRGPSTSGSGSGFAGFASDSAAEDAGFRL
jgi:hypothetical protein